MYSNLTQLGIFRLLHQIANHIRNRAKLEPMLQGAAALLGRSFDVDRCTILTQKQERQEIVLAAEYSNEPLKPLGERRYQLRKNSEWYRLLAAGRPVPLKEI